MEKDIVAILLTIFLLVVIVSGIVVEQTGYEF